MTIQPPEPDRPPAIDGRLDDRAWEGAPVLTGFRVPEDGRAATVRTIVRVLADGRTLFVAFDATGESDRPVTAGGALASADHVTVEVDPSGDRSYLAFSVSQQGERFENGVRQPGPTAWQAAVGEYDDGWTAELAIPLALLRAPSSGILQSIDFIRYRAGGREWSRWAKDTTGLGGDAGARLVLRGSPQPPTGQGLASGPSTAPAARTPAAADGWPVPTVPVLGARRSGRGGGAPADRAAGWVPPRTGDWTPAGAPAAGGPPSAGYVLQLGDVLEIKHFNNPELNELLPIRPDGRISLELVGEVQAAGLAVADLQAILLHRYATYVREPEVAVIVKEFGGNRIYIAGEVNQPGMQETNGHLTALQAIMQAGGFTRGAELRSVVVLRNQGTATPAFLTLDLKNSLEEPGNHLNDTLLRPYDIVFVPKSRVTRMGDFVDQYIDELIPLPVTLGISYLFRR